MKKRLLILLFCFGLSALGFAQETAEPTVFDYAKTKHELSLDIAPIIDGSYPTNLLYRRHYVSKKGKNVALRLGGSIGANVGQFENNSPGGNVQDLNGQSFQVYIGKEWQKTFHPRIIGYYGTDLSFGYGRSFNEFTPNDPNQLPTTRRTTSANIGGTAFLGMRYHLSKHFSISAETSGTINYTNMTIYDFRDTQTSSGEQTIQNNNLGLFLSPLRAIRFSFHF
ncbi:hypothetical protein [Mariniradius sediminis]|uniref:Outer membrane protein beta-barrel domain-containing protein n=1 Tax=Mariniradius sediminis TaxID=2909237 RepID=A0ABS9BV75_9BACT|nr:hypothetical protein [Mariniradius sediminis]MCF1751604.1 hypothetical protein [Mariniradius sediminis]